jgi:hypothetical protein
MRQGWWRARTHYASCRKGEWAGTADKGVVPPEFVALIEKFLGGDVENGAAAPTHPMSGAPRGAGNAKGERAT